MGQRQCCGAGVNHGTVMAVSPRVGLPTDRLAGADAAGGVDVGLKRLEKSVCLVGGQVDLVFRLADSECECPVGGLAGQVGECVRDDVGSHGIERTDA